MSSPYSVDLRKKALEQYNSGNSTQEEIANIFGISLSSFKRWIKKFRETGSLKPSKGDKGRPAKIDQDGFVTIKQAVKENNAITLEDLSLIYFKRHNVQVGNAILSRALTKLNLNRKKLSVKSAEKNSPEAKKKD